MSFPVEIDREEDGRWIAEIPTIPGCLCYGGSREEAIRAVEALALRILAEKVESGSEDVSSLSLFAVPA